MRNFVMHIIEFIGLVLIACLMAYVAVEWSIQ